MKEMKERRRSKRIATDIDVEKRVGKTSYLCKACEISSSGIKLFRSYDLDCNNEFAKIDMPLVKGGFYTSIPSRLVWRVGKFEAFEFNFNSPSQKKIIERVFGASD